MTIIRMYSEKQAREVQRAESAPLATQSISGALDCHSCPRVDGVWTGREDWDVGGEPVSSPPLPLFLASWVLLHRSSALIINGWPGPVIKNKAEAGSIVS